MAHLPSEVVDLVHDLGDRKIVAAAFNAAAPIVNAADSDWSDPRVQVALSQLGVTVIQLLTPSELLAIREANTVS